MFDLVGDMGNHLYGSPQEISAALLADDFGVYLAGGCVACPVQANIDEAFVMTQIQVGFRAIIQAHKLPRAGKDSSYRDRR